jgi:tetratricopeptide (TPR) repeat protein
MTELKKKQIIDNQQVVVQKRLARVHLASNRIEEAINIYADILHLCPDDVDVLMVFGDLYLASQDFATAVKIYEKCARLSPNELEIANRLSLALMEEALFPSEEDPFSDEALLRLTRRLEDKRMVIKASDLERAAKLFDMVLRSENPGSAAAMHLEEIDELLPALLELNIRQSRADRRPDLEVALQQILQSLESQDKALDRKPAAVKPAAANVHIPPAKRFTGRVSLMTPDPAHLSQREDFIYQSLTLRHCSVQLTNQSPMEAAEKPEAVIVCNPHINPWMLESLAACTASHIPLIVDLDADFEQMPHSHPDYTTYGLGSPTNARAYTAALLLANVVTVPSEEMAVSLHRLIHNVAVVPEGWSAKNSLWSKQIPRRSTLNIGWVGNPGQFEDVLEIRRILIRVIREFIQTQLIIAGDPQVYQIFESLPEYRRLYLPQTSQEDFPYLLGQIDILVHPLRSIPYNLTLPDTLLMQAGIKHIPWVASPIPSSMYWKEGGIVANTTEEWHTCLRQMVMEADFRKSLGNAGYQKAQEREIQNMSDAWVDVIEQTLNLCTWPQMTNNDRIIPSLGVKL